MDTLEAIEIDLDGPNGPRVIVTGAWDEETIERILPEGWTVGENWALGVKLGLERFAYPIVRKGGDHGTA